MREATVAAALLAALLAAPATGVGVVVPVAGSYLVVHPGLVGCDDTGVDCVPPCDLGCPVEVDECVAFACVDATIGARFRPDTHEVGFEVWEETNGCAGLQRHWSLCKGGAAPDDLVAPDDFVFAWFPIWLP